MEEKKFSRTNKLPAQRKQWTQFNRMEEGKAEKKQWTQFNRMGQRKCPRTNKLLTEESGEFNPTEKEKGNAHGRTSFQLKESQLEARSYVSISFLPFCWIEFVAFFQLEACSSVSIFFLPFCWIEFVAFFQLEAYSSVSISFLPF